jgi:GH15 family glucan-1,4-alpha-glucosidase
LSDPSKKVFFFFFFFFLLSWVKKKKIKIKNKKKKTRGAEHKLTSAPTVQSRQTTLIINRKNQQERFRIFRRTFGQPQRRSAILNLRVILSLWNQDQLDLR